MSRLALLPLATAALTLPLALFGLGQIGAKVLRQLSGPPEMIDYLSFFTAARLLADDPRHLYDLQTWAALRSQLQVTDMPLMQFWSPPHTALLLAPLAWLPFGVSYALWLAADVACLLAACYLLAPRAPARRWWLLWALLVPLFLPVQLGLSMGQLSFALLLSFALFVRLIRRAGWLAMGLSLLPWTFKPQLLPVLVVVLARERRWPTLLLTCGVALLLSLVVVLLAGPAVAVDYVHLALAGTTGVVTAEGTHLDAGQSVLGLAQWLVGPGALANAILVIGTIVVWSFVAAAWRGGLRADSRQHLQLGMLPLAATLTAPHVLVYDAVLWLAAAWLLLAYAAERPRARPVVWLVLVLGWWGGNLSVLPSVNYLAPWAGLAALAGLAAIAWLYGDGARLQLWSRAACG